MVAQSKQLLEFLVRLVYGIDGLPASSKLFFSRFLVYHFSDQFSVSQIYEVENRKGFQRFGGPKEMADVLVLLSAEEQHFVLAVLWILEDEANHADDRVMGTKIRLLAEALSQVIGLQTPNTIVEALRTELMNSFHAFENRRVIRVPISFWPFLLDFFLRIVALLAFSYWNVERVYLPMINVFCLPLVIIIWMIVLGGRQRTERFKLLKRYGKDRDFRVGFTVSNAQYTWIAVFFGTGVMISYLLEWEYIWVGLGLMTYYFILLRYLQIGHLSENALLRQIEHVDRYHENFTPDQNNELIVRLETRFNSLTGRLDAYVLESALFGALSFSAFLQLMATDLVSLDDLNRFTNQVFDAGRSLIYLNTPGWDSAINGLMTKSMLFCLISVESLICSIFFLTVIASRLRFSDIGDRVRIAINMAKVYNEKEELLLNEQAISGRQLEGVGILTFQINTKLKEAGDILDEVAPVMGYMEYFRNAGILTFVTILISSSLFITGALSWFFILLVFGTYAYFNRVRLGQWLQAMILDFRIYFGSYSRILLVLACLPLAVAVFLRFGLGVREPPFLISLAVVLVCLYGSLSMLLSSHLDERFGDISSDVLLHRWSLIRYLIAFMLLLAAVAVVLTLSRIAGAGFILTISFLSLSFLLSFAGHFLTKRLWLGVYGGLCLAIGSVGVLYGIFRFDHASVFLSVAMLCSGSLIVVMIFTRSLVHRLFRRIVLIVFLLVSYFATPISQVMIIGFQEKVLSVAEVLNEYQTFETVRDLIDQKRITSDRLRTAIAVSDAYIAQCGIVYSGNPVYESLLIRFYDLSAFLAYELKDSSAEKLELGLEASRYGLKLFRELQFKLPSFSDGNILMIESDLLLALNRKAEAVQSLRDLLTCDLPAKYSEMVNEKLIVLEKQMP